MGKGQVPNVGAGAPQQGFIITAVEEGFKLTFFYSNGKEGKLFLRAKYSTGLSRQGGEGGLGKWIEQFGIIWVSRKGHQKGK